MVIIKVLHVKMYWIYLIWIQKYLCLISVADCCCNNDHSRYILRKHGLIPIGVNVGMWNWDFLHKRKTHFTKVDAWSKMNIGHNNKPSHLLFHIFWQMQVIDVKKLHQNPKYCAFSLEQDTLIFHQDNKNRPSDPLLLRYTHLIRNIYLVNWLFSTRLQITFTLKMWYFVILLNILYCGDTCNSELYKSVCVFII